MGGMDQTVRETLEVFNRDDVEEYPRVTLDRALEHEKELTPHLIVFGTGRRWRHTDFTEG